MKSFTLPQKVGLLGGPLVFLTIYSLPYYFLSPEATTVAALALWMIIWWITEAVAIPVTALLPLTLFPLLGIMDLKSVAIHYSNPILYLFFGGFVIALALEKVQLHKRIALSILKLTGTNADGIVLGFMLATALMSMWISNTASTVVMLPIAVSVISLLIQNKETLPPKAGNFSLAIMLGIAFSANIGGMGTIVGTPPTVMALGFLGSEHGIEIGFLQWMKMGIPFVILMLSCCYILLVKVFYPSGLGHIESSGTTISSELAKLGKISHGEKVVLIIFFLTALSWILRSQLNQWFPALKLSDTSIAMVAAISLFVVPLNWKKGEFPLDWNDTQRLPWGILVLFGGGLALASGLSQTGIVDFIGELISAQESWSVFMIGSVLIALMLFMTELIGNLALVAILVPFVAGIAIGIDSPIVQIVIPVTLASSCAFMLPMATPPNAIVFASGHIKVYQMARVGLAMNLVSILFLIGIAFWVVPELFV